MEEGTAPWHNMTIQVGALNAITHYEAIGRRKHKLHVRLDEGHCQFQRSLI